MGRHHAPDSHTTGDHVAIRTMFLAMIGLTIFVVAMIASYSGAFAKPTLHHLTVAVAGPQQLVEGVRSHDGLVVNPVGDDAAARQQILQRSADAAFVAGKSGDMKIYVAGGGGRSVAAAAETVGRTIAANAGLPATVNDVAPTAAGNPSGTVEFYAVIFISIGASVGAAVFGRLRGSVRNPRTLVLRTITLAGYSALLAGCVTAYVDVVLHALVGHPWQVFGALWLYSMAVGGAVSGAAAAFGTVASMALTLFLVIIGNAAAAGPVGRPLLSGFYSEFNAVVPQGSGVSLLRSIEYFDGHGAHTPVVTLTIWAAAGCLLAVLATASRVNHRALLRWRLLSPARG